MTPRHPAVAPALLTCLALGSTLGSGCGREPLTLRSDGCAALLLLARGQASAIRGGRSVRQVSRAQLERLDQLWRRAASRCRKGPRGLLARVSRARQREEIARASRAPEDIRAALLAYEEVSRSHPRTKESAWALWRRAALTLDLDRPRVGFELLKLLAQDQTLSGRRARAALEILHHMAPSAPAPVPSPGRRSRPRPADTILGTSVDPDRLSIRFPSDGRASRLLRVRRWSTPAFSRVVSYFDRPVRYSHGALPAATARPARLYIDFPGARLSGAVSRADAERGHLVQGLRLANRPPRSVRLVLDLAGPLRYQIYPLQHHYRVVVDLWKPALRPTHPKGRPRVKVVALDPGHGGTEAGAVGPTGLKEKDVTLDIARHAARLLKGAGLKAVLTRDGDRTVSLEERSAIALAVDADILVSIHANADPTRKQQGVETYYLDVGSDQYAAKLAARENRAAGRPIGGYRLVLADLTTRANTALSRQLATVIHHQVLGAARVGRPRLPDRGVRRAIFYVLLTARVPGVLVEVSFISSLQGEAALRQAEARKRIGESIGRGILQYAKRK